MHVPNVMIGKTSPFDPEKEADKLREYIGQIKIKNENEAIPEGLRSWIINELCLSVQDNFIMTAEGLKKFLSRTVTKDDWDKKVNSDPKFHGRWKDGETVIQPIFDVSAKNITNPSETFALFPPIAKSMVRDYLFNVIHSSRKIDQDDLSCDMQCSVAVQGEDILLVTMWNHVDQDKTPKPKPAEGVVSLQLKRDPVSCEHCDGKFFVRIQLPMVEHLYRGEK